MKVVALLAIRNEELYLDVCLDRLRREGIETVLIDNESTDKSVEIATKYLGRGVSHIEKMAFNGEYEWLKILRFKERLARDIEADWFIHHDADEVREAPWGFRNLIDGITKVDERGYNAINSDEFVFVPTNCGESYEGTNYIREMKYYYYFRPGPNHRVNIWKKTQGAVDLCSSGGHRVGFDRQYIAPINFVLRHYMLLSRDHAIRKYGRRKYAAKEVAIGMHRARARMVPELIEFPDKSELKRIDCAGNWDKSDPWRQHCFASTCG